MKPIRLGLTGLMLILPLSGVLAQSISPDIKADSGKEAREIRNGAADTSPSGGAGMSKSTGGDTAVRRDQSDTMT